jgi:hypothetical protein
MRELDFKPTILGSGFQLGHLSVGSVALWKSDRRTGQFIFSRTQRFPSLVRFPLNRWNGRGDLMPRYISQHTLACLTRQGAEQLSSRLQKEGPVSARRVLVNMHEGKMLVEFEAPGREELEKWLAAEKFHFDWLLRIELESAGGAPLAAA